MTLFELISEYLSKDITIQFTWSAPVLKRDEESWIEDTKRAFSTLTTEDVETVFKWCNFTGNREEVVVAAIKSLILPEDLPIGCQCKLTFVPKANNEEICESQ